MNFPLLFGFTIVLFLLHVTEAQYAGLFNNPLGLGFGSESYQPIGDAARYDRHVNYYYNYPRNTIY